MKLKTGAGWESGDKSKGGWQEGGKKAGSGRGRVNV